MREGVIVTDAEKIARLEDEIKRMGAEMSSYMDLVEGYSSKLEQAEYRLRGLLGKNWAEVSAKLESVEALQSRLDSAQKRIDALEARLELTYYTMKDGEWEPDGKCDIGDTDGIACRDATIALQEQNCETLRAVRKELESRLDQVRLALANRESYGDEQVAISTIRHIVGEKWIAESNPGSGVETEKYPLQPKGAATDLNEVVVERHEHIGSTSDPLPRGDVISGKSWPGVAPAGQLHPATRMFEQPYEPARCKRCGKPVGFAHQCE